jgi:hypothetical protein
MPAGPTLPNRGVSGASEMEKLLEPTSDATWVLVTEGYDALREGI